MDRDLIQLRQCMHCLQQCEWYKGRMSKRRAKELLRRCRPGSFLLRDSDNPQYRTVAKSKKALKGQISEKSLKKTEKYKKVNFHWQVTNYFYKIKLFFETSPTKQHTLLQLFSYLFSLSQNLHFVGPIATRIFFQDGLFWFDDGRQRFGNAGGNSSRGTGSTERV